MSNPDCEIIVTYNRPNRVSSLLDNRFSYHCIRSSRGWRLHMDGSVFPPSRSRIVQFRLHPTSSYESFSGFQLISAQKGSFTSEPQWSNREEMSKNLGVQLIDPEPYPPSSEKTAAVLTLDFTGQKDYQLLYRLAVGPKAGKPKKWDDPKVYNDGSE